MLFSIANYDGIWSKSPSCSNFKLNCCRQLGKHARLWRKYLSQQAALFKVLPTVKSISYTRVCTSVYHRSQRRFMYSIEIKNQFEWSHFALHTLAALLTILFYLPNGTGNLQNWLSNYFKRDAITDLYSSINVLIRFLNFKTKLVCLGYMNYNLYNSKAPGSYGALPAPHCILLLSPTQ